MYGKEENQLIYYERLLFNGTEAKFKLNVNVS